MSPYLTTLCLLEQGGYPVHLAAPATINHWLKQQKDPTWIATAIFAVKVPYEPREQDKR